MTSSVDGFPTVGVVGGGQLARMMQQPAIALGINLRVLAASPEDPAAQVISDVRIGSHEDREALLEFAKGCDVVTFDHEHVPPAFLHEMREAGVAVLPSPEALIHAQDKITMRLALSAAGLPCPVWGKLIPNDDFSNIESVLSDFGDQAGWPIVLKTSRGGYDGRGVWVANDLGEACSIVSTTDLPDNAAWLLEAKVPFTRELAAQVARSPHGQAVAYPVVESVQTNGICAEVTAPAPDLDEGKALEAQQIALRVAEAIGVTGMLAVELFDTPDGLLINELAMRPHNSGHWSIDGAVTSQFENHLRAILNLPLGSPAARSPYTVMVNVLGTDRDQLYSAYKHVLARDPRIKVHLYGKEPRPGRKLGHVNVTGDNLDDLLERARHGAGYLSGAIDE